MNSEKKVPKGFIASSVEGLDIAYEIQSELQLNADCTVWSQGVFGPTEYPLESLENALESHDFGIFVLTPDDIVWMESREEEHRSARDNVIAELFLFIGRYGRKRVFLVAPEKNTPHLPSDLAGLSPLKYRWEKDAGRDLRAALGTPVHQIRRVLKKMIESGAFGPIKPTGIASGAKSYVAPVNLANIEVTELFKYLEDIIGMVSIGSAGLEITQADSITTTTWYRNVLEMLVRIFHSRQSDVSATWLRPDEDPEQLILHEAAGQHHGADHYKYRKEEGLAGKVWSRGQAAAVGPGKPHEWWVVRKDCMNSTYICAPIGEPGSRSGILAVGSDSGFELNDSDIQIVKVFAKILSLSIDRKPALRTVGQPKKRSG